jgi:ankyrin repeat protein
MSNSNSNSNNTPFIRAVNSLNIRRIREFLNQGTSPNTRTKENWSVLSAVSGVKHPMRNHYKSLHVVRELLRRGAAVNNKTGIKKATALLWACYAGNTSIAKMLIDHGANVNSRAIDGSTPLHAACVRNNLGCVRLLLQHHAHVYSRDENGVTPLVYACRVGNLEMIRLLVQAGALYNSNSVRRALNVTTNANVRAILSNRPRVLSMLARREILGKRKRTT